MSDIGPKPIAATSGVMPALPTAAPAATNTATAAEIPAAVANLSVGTFITGTVIERSPRGLVTLRTDKGTIKLQTPVPLKTGSTVTLQIQSVGAQVQLSILSIDGQPVAHAPVKPPPGQIRPDVTGKPSATEPAPARPQGQATSATSQPLIGDDGHEATTIRQTSADRAAPDRGIAPRATTAQPTPPAASFVARPLTQIGSAGLEALSSPSASSPPATASSPIPSPPTAAPAVAGNFIRAATPTIAGTTAPIAHPSAAAQTATNPSSVIQAPVPTAGQTSAAAPTATPVTGAVNPNASIPTATVAPAVTSSASASLPAPAIIAPGTQFTASLVAFPTVAPATAEPGQPVSPSLKPDVAPPALPSSLPGPATVPTAPMVSETTSAADRVILRLLGMDRPQTPQSMPATTSVATAAAPRVLAASAASSMPSPAAEPRVAAGVIVPSGALTTVGTIVDGPDLPHPATQPPAASAQAPANARTWIATPFGLLAAPGPAPGPVGTRLLLEVVLRGEPAPLAPQPAAGLPTMAMSAPAADKTWPALREIITTVQTIAPDVAEHLANVTLPRVGPNLAASMMAFVAAARQGNPRAWLGEQTADTLLRTGHGHLLDRLSDDFQIAARVAADTGPHGWQTMLLPLYDGERLQQIRFYWQRQKRKSNERKDGTRFVVEAELTKLGVLQLDGIFDKPQFDLVVRTSTSLPAPIRGDIIEIFGDALLATNLKGAVSFQTNAGLRLGALAGGEEPGPDAGIGLIV